MNPNKVKVLYQEETFLDRSRNVGDSVGVRTTLYRLTLAGMADLHTYLLIQDRRAPKADSWTRQYETVLPVDSDAAAIRTAIQEHDEAVDLTRNTIASDASLDAWVLKHNQALRLGAEPTERESEVEGEAAYAELMAEEEAKAQAQGEAEAAAQAQMDADATADADGEEIPF